MAKRHDKKKEAARRMREQRAREQRRKQLRWGFGIVGAVLVVGALVATVMIVSQPYEVHQPKAESTKTALVLSEKDKKPKVKLELYEDFICPACGSFQTSYGEAIDKAVKDGKVELKFHPLNFLAGASSTDYSLRAASAATCAADEGKFFEYEKQLFANQPPEGGAGLPDDELVKFGEDVGLGKKFEKCVKDGRYYGWIEQVTEDATSDNVSSTPTVILNGKKLENTEGFDQQLQEAIKQAYPDEKENENGDKKN